MKQIRALEGLWADPGGKQIAASLDKRIAVGLLLLIGAGITLLTGCATTPYSVPVDANVGLYEQYRSRGIPYYLPRPYLVITKNFEGKTTTTSKTTAKTPDGKETVTETVKTEDGGIATNRNVYTMRVIYLPDYSQKHALRFRRGAGSYKTTITLSEGWNLTGLNADGDSKTPETISAVGTSVKEIAEAISIIKMLEDVGTDAEVSTLNAKHREDILTDVLPLLKARLESAPSGIWIYDLFGSNAFQQVFSWTEPETKQTSK